MDKHVSRVVNPIVSMCFSAGNRGPRGILPGVRRTLGIGHPSKHSLIVRIRRRVNRSAIHYITVSGASNLRHNLRITIANGPVVVPTKRRVGNHVVGMVKRPVSNVGRLSVGNTCPVRHRTPGFSRLSARGRVLTANVGIVSLLRPCVGNNGVNLFNNTNMNGAILVVRLVGGVTGKRGNCSMFTNMNRHAHRNGSLVQSVLRSNIVGCNRGFHGTVRRNG